MREVHDEVDVHVREALVEKLQRGCEVVIEALRTEGHFLGADAHQVHPGFGSRRHVFVKVFVRQHHRVAAGQQHLTDRVAGLAGLRIHAAIVGELAVVLQDVGLQVVGLDQALAGGAIEDVEPVAVAAVGRAGQGRVAEHDLVVLVQDLALQALGAVANLV